MKFGCSTGIFLNTANLICQSTDISNCFGGSLRLRDNESRLYMKPYHYDTKDWERRAGTKEWKLRSHRRLTCVCTISHTPSTLGANYVSNIATCSWRIVLLEHIILNTCMWISLFCKFQWFYIIFTFWWVTFITGCYCVRPRSPES